MVLVSGIEVGKLLIVLEMKLQRRIFRLRRKR